jgi:RNA polymerase sigma factor (TIGR02999 family)
VKGELFVLVYEELRRIAGSKMAGESAALTLQPTALVHEAWLRLGADAQPKWESREHFFAAAAEAMRRILIDRARRRAAQRHGGGLERVNLETMDVADMAGRDELLLAINDALEKLAATDAAKAELVKLRYFGGLTMPEAAQALGVSEATAHRWWAYARAWLGREIRRGESAHSQRDEASKGA